MSGYEYEDETEKVTWSIVNDIKQVTDDIISTIIHSITEVSANQINFFNEESVEYRIKVFNYLFSTGMFQKRQLCF